MNRIIVSMVALFASISFLHGGRTDAQGGHYDRSTGEYHFHHGYPAHDHYDIDGDGTVDCPYRFDDNTIHKNPNSSGNKDNAVDKTDKPSTNNEKAKNKITSKDIIEIILVIVFFIFPAYGVLMFVFGEIVQFIEKLAKKLANKELKISESDRFWKYSSLVMHAVAIVIITFLMLRAKGIL